MLDVVANVLDLGIDNEDPQIKQNDTNLTCEKSPLSTTEPLQYYTRKEVHLTFITNDLDII